MAQTGVPAITRPTSSVRSIPILVPPFEIFVHFSALVAPIHLRKGRADDESRTLAALRDALLPKLISGEIRIKDAERMAVGVT